MYQRGCCLIHSNTQCVWYGKVRCRMVWCCMLWDQVWKVSLTLRATNYPLQPCVTSHALAIHQISKDMKSYSLDGLASDLWIFQQHHFSIACDCITQLPLYFKAKIVHIPIRKDCIGHVPPSKCRRVTQVMLISWTLPSFLTYTCLF